MSTRRRVVIVGVVVLALGVFGWLILRDSGDNILEEVARRGALYVAIEGDHPPFSVLNEAGEVVGLDADLARALAEALGVTVHFEVMGYDSLYDALDVGRVDVIISAVWVDPDRLGEFRYSVPYFDAGQVLAVRAEDAGRITAPADLEGLRLGVEFGSAGDVWSRRQQRRLHTLHIEPYNAPVAVLDALAAGAVDAAVIDTISLRLYAGEDAELTAVASVEEEPYAVVTRLESGALREALDEALRAMIEDGQLAALIEAWL